MEFYKNTARYHDAVVQKYFDYAKVAKLFKREAKGKTVLEVGVGSGMFLDQLTKLGYDATGIDTSMVMLNLARKRIPPRKARLIKSDVKTFNLNQNFDTITTFQSVFVFIKKGRKYQVITYLKNKKEVSKALKNIYKHLRPGGVFVINEQKKHDKPSKKIKFGDLTYEAQVDEIDKNRYIRRYIIRKGKKVIGKSEITKLRIDFDEFKQILEGMGFKIKGFDKTKYFFIARKL